MNWREQQVTAATETDRQTDREGDRERDRERDRDREREGDRDRVTRTYYRIQRQ